jgi:hypothetical protein
VDRPVSSRGVRPPRANGGTGSVFLNLDRLGPNHVDRAGPCTVDRPGLDRADPDRTVFNTLAKTKDFTPLTLGREHRDRGFHILFLVSCLFYNLVNSMIKKI